MQEIIRTIGRYFFPVLVIIIGSLLLATSGDQTQLFKMGGAGILLSGILGVLFVAGVVTRPLQIVIGIVFGAAAIFFIYKDFDVIEERQAYDRLKTQVNAEVIQRLKDIRKAQLAYNREYGTYTDNFDTLIDFLKNRELRLIKRLGSLPDTIPTEAMARELGLIHQMPDTLTEEEVIASGMIVRDTIYVPVGPYVFDESDAKTRKFPLYIDSLPYVPYSDHKFKLETATIQSGGVQQNVFQVIDPKPFEPNKPLKVGSLESASTAGNWNE